MPWPVPFLPTEQIETGRTASRPTQVTVTASGTAHTKGAYTEVIASTGNAGYWVIIWISGSQSSGVDTAMLLDIAIGAAASEVIIFPDLGAGFREVITGGTAAYFISFPYYIPSASRISARVQAAVIDDTVLVGIDVLGSAPSSALFAVMDTYGENAATSKGVLLATGGSDDTKGAWAEIDASTGNEIDALIISVQSDAGTLADDFVVDIGAGAAASEVVVVADFPFRSSAGEGLMARYPCLIPLGLSVPAGTRLAARIAGDASRSDYYVHLHGLRM